MAHTPGPWTIEPCTLETRIGGPFCGQYLVNGPRCSDGRFSEADAKLIAAAPDLADALRDALGVIEILTITAESGDITLAARGAYHTAKSCDVEARARAILGAVTP